MRKPKSNMLFRLTKTQKRALYNCNVGVGTLAYKMGHNQLHMVDFFVTPKGELRRVGDGKPVTLELIGLNEDQGAEPSNWDVCVLELETKIK